MGKRKTVKTKWIEAALQDYEGPLIRYATRILGDVEGAREVVQDTFLRLCREDRGRIGAHLAQWLFTVCRHRSLDIRKKENRMTRLEKVDLGSCPDPDSTPFRLLEQKEELSRILQAVEDLPPNQQEVLRLRFQHEFSYKQISAVTGLSVSHVGVLLHTAIQNLRRKLNPVPMEQPAMRRIK